MHGGRLALALVAVTASGHHSLDATYDLKTEVRLEGKVVQFLLRNPHSFLVMEDRNMQRWSLEWDGANSLAKAGITRDTLKNGDGVVVTLHPARTALDHRGVLSALHRESDGLAWDPKAKRNKKPPTD
ncbi:MAG TPA: DUF6152 family protein [Bryobacteraceae bacterium]|jgi:hypothetical protein